MVAMPIKKVNSHWNTLVCNRCASDPIAAQGPQVMIFTGRLSRLQDRQVSNTTVQLSLRAFGANPKGDLSAQTQEPNWKTGGLAREHTKNR